MVIGNTVDESRKGKPVGNHENRERDLELVPPAKLLSWPEDL